MYTYTYTYGYFDVHMYIRTSVMQWFRGIYGYIFLSMNVYVYIYTYIWIFECTHVHQDNYIRTSVMYMCTLKYPYVYIASHLSHMDILIYTCTSGLV